MLWYEILIFLYGTMHFAVLFLLFITDAYCGNGFAWVNPLFIYRHAKVNWFGASLLALIANVSIPCWAIMYWIYKLCTVGRR